MKDKKERCEHRKEVKINAVAESLPVDVWFDKNTFSINTGIKLSSCQHRIRTLVKKGLLDIKPVGNRQSKYKMSFEMKLKMISLAKTNILNHGASSAETAKENKIVKVTEKQLLSDEIEAHKDNAYRILQSARFV